MNDGRGLDRALAMLGVRFGSWTVESVVGVVDGRMRVRCLCCCGVRRNVDALSIRSGRSKSCGCIHPALVHGMTNTRLHSVWKNMIQRCTNERARNFQRYGGRGISVCSRWMTFENFAQDMGNPPSVKHSIDRIDNDKGYSPDNCRWATHEEQMRNMRGNLLLTHDGRTMCLAAWADERGLTADALSRRLKRGMSVDQALSRPLQQRRAYELAQ